MVRPSILILEPYYGGSHRQFIDGLIEELNCPVTLLTLPPRKFKMRMQLSAPWFAAQLRRRSASQRYFSAVFATALTDLAVFKALTVSLPGWNPSCRYLVYFHENQFVYPGRLVEPADHQFAMINFSTALVADELAFNSHYNRCSFLTSCRNVLARETDTDVCHEVDRIAAKSHVLYPGVDFSDIDAGDEPCDQDGEPLVIWNHRWEHDKNPEEFLSTLRKLSEQGLGFDCALLGQRFRAVPDCFHHARDWLGSRCLQFGFVEQRADYIRFLRRGTCVVSTALHEFFGISVLEAVRAGCVPVVPDRLVYPELYESAFRYDDGLLAQRLREVITAGKRLSKESSRAITDRFSWERQRAAFVDWIIGESCPA